MTDRPAQHGSAPEVKRRKTSAWDQPPSATMPLPSVPLAAAGVALDAQKLDVIHKVAFFVARYGNHLEDMTRERQKSEARLKWLWHKTSPEYMYYKAKVRDIRNRLKEVRQEYREILVPPEDDHHVTAAKLVDKVQLAKLDAIYTQRERDQVLAVNSPAGPAGTIDTSLSGHHLQDFIPDGVMVEFLQKSMAVKQQKAIEATPQASTQEKAGLGSKAVATHDPQDGDDEFTLYKKRMMLAYKFRPNPLGNPRTPYY